MSVVTTDGASYDFPMPIPPKFSLEGQTQTQNHGRHTTGLGILGLNIEGNNKSWTVVPFDDYFGVPAEEESGTRDSGIVGVKVDGRDDEQQHQRDAATRVSQYHDNNELETTTGTLSTVKSFGSGWGSDYWGGGEKVEMNEWERQEIFGASGCVGDSKEGGESVGGEVRKSCAWYDKDGFLKNVAV